MRLYPPMKFSVVLDLGEDQLNQRVKDEAERLLIGRHRHAYRMLTEKYGNILTTSHGTFQDATELFSRMMAIRSGKEQVS